MAFPSIKTIVPPIEMEQVWVFWWHIRQRSRKKRRIDQKRQPRDEWYYLSVSVRMKTNRQWMLWYLAFYFFLIFLLLLGVVLSHLLLSIIIIIIYNSCRSCLIVFFKISFQIMITYFYFDPNLHQKKYFFVFCFFKRLVENIMV